MVQKNFGLKNFWSENFFCQKNVCFGKNFGPTFFGKIGSITAEILLNGQMLPGHMLPGQMSLGSWDLLKIVPGTCLWSLVKIEPVTADMDNCS